ncbi:MAG: HlyC/CorC family transporter [Candidatus Eisenbacteria bacterium]|nr:HlyC/CorC family transporter [Candidatus Eisenbacteria bacterium]
MAYAWFLGLMLACLTALSGALVVREAPCVVRGDRRGVEARYALILVTAVASAVAGATAVGTGADVSALVPAVLVLTWLVLVTAGVVAAPLWFAGSTGPQGLGGRALRLFWRLFVLPLGGLAIRISEKVTGPAMRQLDERLTAELNVLFSAETAALLRADPRASVVREFARTTAEDIMVPRSAMVTVASSMTLAECVEVFAAKKFSRMPVYEQDPESIIGTVHVMDLLRETDLSGSVRRIVRPVPMVPKTKKCDELLKEFQAGRSYMAVVLDEYGGTAGLVTVEDVLEELVGEMGYEPLALRRTVRKVVDGVFLVHAQVEVEKFEKAVGIKIPKGDYETLAGYLLQEFGRIPKPGAKLVRNGTLFEVVEADERKIKLVRVWFEGLYPRQDAAEAIS